MRRAAVLSAVVLATAAVVAAAWALGRDDDPPPAADPVTTTAPPITFPPGPPPEHLSGDDVVRPSRSRDGVEGVSDGALAAGGRLTQPASGPAVTLAGPNNCGPAWSGFEPAGCVVVDASGGRFAVVAGARRDGAHQVRLWRRAGGDRFDPVVSSPVFEPGGEVVGLAVSQGMASGEAVAVVAYDLGGSGSVYDFDVVAWESGTPAPGLRVAVDGQGHDRLAFGNGLLRVVSADHSDGAPACCPEQAVVRTIGRDASGRWTVETQVVPWSDAP